MLRTIWCCLLLLLPSIASSQVHVGSWPTELTAGAGLDLVARGPWIAPSWRNDLGHRLFLTQSINAFYEFVLEPWNGYPGNRVSDFGQRLIGTLVAEGLIHVIRRIR